MSTQSKQSEASKLTTLSHAIVGCLGKIDEQYTRSKTAETMAAALNTQRDLHHASGSNYACASTSPCHLEHATGVVGIIIGNPQWTQPTLKQSAEQYGHTAALTLAYQSHGDELAAHLRGAYAFAVLDTKTDSVVLGIDRMGRYPLYYSATENGLVFGTSARSILALQNETATMNEQCLYNYFYFHMVPAPQPVFRDMQKLQAGYTVFGNAAALAKRRHWNPSFSEHTNEDRPSLYAELRKHLKQSVATCLPRSGKKVGAFLSGGLDSSTVTGMLAEVSDGPCEVYSIGFSAEGYDEMAYARITANHFGANLHEYYVTPEDVVEALPLIAAAYDEPFGNSSALPAYFCAKLAADDGVSLLLAGDGGDEIFAGNERYAKQKTFEAYQYLPRFLCKNILEPLINSAPQWAPLAQKARSFIAQANTPLPDRLHTYNFLHQNLAGEIFQESFLSGVNTDYPLTIQREVFQQPSDASILNRMLFLDWQFTLADNDLRKVSQTCAVAGVDVAYPMLDDDLVDFSMGIPSEMKLPGKQLRDFYKKALRGWLPEATLNKSKQGFGLPFGVWMSTHRPLQEIAYDNILKLKSRGIFNSAFLENAIAMHRTGHAAYFGELIWILCVLELWMSSHLDENYVYTGKES
jgi:asparagine synthase (glutamine-hydrolysing)